jgi:prevent-host-death family protein
MSTDLAQFESDRIARYLRNRLGEHAWPIKEAKAKLTKIMKEAKEGKPQVVGVRHPVVMVGLDELEEFVLSLREPETWGEYFATKFDEDSDNVDLTSPSRPGIAEYQLDSTEPNVEIESDFDDKLALAQAYADVGDSEAASLILSGIRGKTKSKESPTRQVTLELGNLFAGIRDKSHREQEARRDRIERWIEQNPVGSKVDCRILSAKKNVVFVDVADVAKGVAITRTAESKRLRKGTIVKAVVVKRDENYNVIAVSLKEPSGEILKPQELLKGSVRQGSGKSTT